MYIEREGIEHMTRSCFEEVMHDVPQCNETHQHNSRLKGLMASD